MPPAPGVSQLELAPGPWDHLQFSAYWGRALYSKGGAQGQRGHSGRWPQQAELQESCLVLHSGWNVSSFQLCCYFLVLL